MNHNRFARRPVNAVVKERGCSYTIAWAIPMPIMNGTLNLLVAIRANFTFFIKFSNLPLKYDFFETQSNSTFQYSS